MCSFRPVVLAVEQRQQRELDEKEQELAAKVARATCEQLIQKVHQDMATLRARVPTKEKEAAESLLDQKYLRDRQKPFGTVFHISTIFKYVVILIRCNVIRIGDDHDIHHIAVMAPSVRSKDWSRMVPAVHGVQVQAEHC